MKIKTGDNVRVIAGKDKGKTGKVMQTFAEMDKIVVDGINQATKHIKKRGDQPGQKVDFFAPIHVSNVRVVGKKGEGRVGYKKIEKDGKSIKARVIKTKAGVEDLK